MLQSYRLLIFIIFASLIIFIYITSILLTSSRSIFLASSTFISHEKHLHFFYYTSILTNYFNLVNLYYSVINSNVICSYSLFFYSKHISSFLIKNDGIGYHCSLFIKSLYNYFSVTTQASPSLVFFPSNS